MEKKIEQIDIGDTEWELNEMLRKYRPEVIAKILDKIVEIVDYLNNQPQAGVFTEFTDKNISDDIPKGFVDIDGKLHKFEYNPEEWSCPKCGFDDCYLYKNSEDFGLMYCPECKELVKLNNKEDGK